MQNPHPYSRILEIPHPIHLYCFLLCSKTGVVCRHKLCVFHIGTGVVSSDAAAAEVKFVSLKTGKSKEGRSAILQQEGRSAILQQEGRSAILQQEGRSAILQQEGSQSEHLGVLKLNKQLGELDLLPGMRLFLFIVFSINFGVFSMVFLQAFM